MTWGNRFRLLFGAIAVLVVLAGLTLVFNQRQHSATSETATLTAVDYPVGSTYPGTVTEVDVKEGQRVRSGDPLVSVRSASLLHDLRQGLVTAKSLGYTVSKSGVIQFHAVKLSGKLGGAPGEEPEVLRWVLWDNHKLSSQAGMTRFMINFLPEKHRNPDVIDFAKGRLKAAYAVRNNHLDGRDWIVGDAITNADLSCCGYLYYPEPFGFDRKDWPHIDAWLDRIAALPGWKHPYDLMPGRPSDRGL